jgi:mRNA interferase MazF
MQRGEIWVAHLGSSTGRVPGKTRPVLILQAQALLDDGHPSTVIIPLTTRLDPDGGPLRVHISARGTLKHDADLLIDHIRSVDNRRIVRGPIACLDSAELTNVGQALIDLLTIAPA